MEERVSTSVEGVTVFSPASDFEILILVAGAALWIAHFVTLLGGFITEARGLASNPESVGFILGRSSLFAAALLTVAVGSALWAFAFLLAIPRLGAKAQRVPWVAPLLIVYAGSAILALIWIESLVLLYASWLGSGLVLFFAASDVSGHFRPHGRTGFVGYATLNFVAVSLILVTAILVMVMLGTGFLVIVGPILILAIVVGALVFFAVPVTGIVVFSLCIRASVRMSMEPRTLAVQRGSPLVPPEPPPP